MKTSNQQGSLAFLDTLVSVDSNGSLITTVFGKPTHMCQYLHWDSHHSITNKYSVYNTLICRAQTVCSNQQLFGQEYQDIKPALSRWKYPDWVSDRLQIKMDYNPSLKHCSNSPNPHMDTLKDIFIVVSYSKGLRKGFKYNVGKWESRYTSRPTIQLRIYCWFLRTGRALSTKEVSSVVQVQPPWMYNGIHSGSW